MPEDLMCTRNQRAAARRRWPAGRGLDRSTWTTRAAPSPRHRQGTNRALWRHCRGHDRGRSRARPMVSDKDAGRRRFLYREARLADGPATPSGSRSGPTTRSTGCRPPPIDADPERASRTSTTTAPRAHQAAADPPRYGQSRVSDAALSQHQWRMGGTAARRGPASSGRVRRARPRCTGGGARDASPAARGRRAAAKLEVVLINAAEPCRPVV
jgi:hypothetical protein